MPDKVNSADSLRAAREKRDEEEKEREDTASMSVYSSTNAILRELVQTNKGILSAISTTNELLASIAVLQEKGPETVANSIIPAMRSMSLVSDAGRETSEGVGRVLYMDREKIATRNQVPAALILAYERVLVNVINQHCESLGIQSLGTSSNVACYRRVVAILVHTDQFVVGDSLAVSQAGVRNGLRHICTSEESGMSYTADAVSSAFAEIPEVLEVIPLVVDLVKTFPGLVPQSSRKALMCADVSSFREGRYSLSLQGRYQGVLQDSQEHVDALFGKVSALNQRKRESLVSKVLESVRGKTPAEKISMSYAAVMRECETAQE
ncbi:hypothetical protein JB92DRAFT_3114848 [Gautieria morchelliformis]|nr:hypothetical protein JB92DRAFT_3114848 [Gautieria morchelliformis]